jgi:hypothetical protein
MCIVGDQVWSSTVDLGLDMSIMFPKALLPLEWAVRHPMGYFTLHSGDSINMFSSFMIDPITVLMASPLLGKDIGFGGYDPDYDVNIFRALPSDVIAIGSTATCRPQDCPGVAGYVYITSNLSVWLYSPTKVTRPLFWEYSGWQSELVGHVLEFD